MAATVFWFMYLGVCPVATLVVIFVCSWVPDDAVGAICASALGLGILVFVFGPVHTNVGVMSWWLRDSGLTSFDNARYWVWQYALACAALSAVLVLLKQRTLNK